MAEITESRQGIGCNCVANTSSVGFVAAVAVAWRASRCQAPVIEAGEKVRGARGRLAGSQGRRGLALHTDCPYPAPFTLTDATGHASCRGALVAALALAACNGDDAPFVGPLLEADSRPQNARHSGQDSQSKRDSMQGTQ